MFTPLDQSFMRRALELAERGMYTTTPNPRVGAVIAGVASARLPSAAADILGLPAVDEDSKLVTRRRSRKMVRGTSPPISTSGAPNCSATPPCPKRANRPKWSPIARKAGDLGR